jgi:hypothetical protein
MYPQTKFKKYSRLLIVLGKLKNKEDQSIILNHLDGNSINFICETIHNTIHGNINISRRKRKILKNNLLDKKHCFEKLSKKSTKLNEKRVIIKQLGGSISLLLAAVTPIIAQLVAQFLPKILNSKK